VKAPKVGMGSTLGTSMIKNRHRGVLGESLTIYRTAWAHEQRVLDDYLVRISLCFFILPVFATAEVAVGCFYSHAETCPSMSV
jgi:hypothetical protein